MKNISAGLPVCDTQPCGKPVFKKNCTKATIPDEQLRLLAKTVLTVYISLTQQVRKECVYGDEERMAGFDS